MPQHYNRRTFGGPGTQTPTAGFNPFPGSQFRPSPGTPVVPETPRTASGEVPGVQRARDVGQSINELGRVTELDLLGGSFGSRTGGGAGGGVGSLPPIAFPDTTAATDAAFARAKDRTGQNVRASLTGLSENLASRGLMGGRLEGGARGEVIGRAGSGLNEVIREQAIQDALGAQRRASEEFQGRITQRGQDIQVAQSANEQRNRALQGLLSFINPERLF
jgi:hypothetical protein